MKQGVDHVGVCVVYFCHDGKGNFVMAKRSAQSRDEQGRWDIGGGALELGERVEDALKKEIAEEYCTDVLSFEFLGYRDVHRVQEERDTHWIALEFKVLVDRKKVRRGEPHKFDEVRWFGLDYLPDEKELHSQLPAFLEEHKARL